MSYADKYTQKSRDALGPDYERAWHLPKKPKLLRVGPVVSLSVLVAAWGSK